MLSSRGSLILKRFHGALSRAPVLPRPGIAVRTRFAPSPTGFLHLGGLRTALYSFLLARRTGGEFILRIEDTDHKRLVPAAEARLLSDLHWAGLSWDEGPDINGPYGPYRQSNRADIYTTHANQLIHKGKAYRCFCPPQRVKEDFVTSDCYQSCNTLNKDASAEKAHRGEKFTVRLSPLRTSRQKFPDLVYGNIKPLTRSGSTAGEILLKSNGMPTYHLANVVDDHLMAITHVVRGSEWMASTPLHYHLYDAFGWQPPSFAHVGLLADEKGRKLSKRSADGEVEWSLSSLKENCVLPAALTNFVALLGWSNPTRSDVLSLSQLGEVFDLKFTRGNATVQSGKLWYLQKKHVALLAKGVREGGSREALQPLVAPMMQVVRERFPDFVAQRGEVDLQRYCEDVILADERNFTSPRAFLERNKFFFAWDNSGDSPSVLEQVESCVEEMMNALQEKNDSYSTDSEGLWFDNEITPDMEKQNTLKRDVSQFLRLRLSDGLPGPSIGVLMAILGCEECRRRIKRYINNL
ncbi:hypothetical protein K470DRAFT_248241 [Piedraia hortae CBS 480.64]|uniref:glutamate--tRNA ligase n=1 Tax=Piedraia hortae CBS 480.64 TaxID=1314780 RepID=A0A6A7BXR7_9PEZI|nr:hypothetical protein K470DRAFT_248241 [Piedraia hortae CBS 480.64]